ncbi:hypothetical protein [Sphingomonas sp. BK345]|uniref:hypothetical protein n=1 Tax=Sphingomonas sp. BK345 TaxID=2586980 RepID=UPI00160E70FC|nr:hypothetical protein [Sphingomonas sp. BK345]MBB3473483.1 hypothetical protein [Sphingomonas sp. BK345]
MNFTLALLAGLVLLLPGITALVSWNFQNVYHGAKRPELQLTSVTALFAALGIALAMHLLGYGLVSLGWAAAAQLGEASGHSVGPLIANPYDMAVALALGSAKASAASLFAFALTVLFECLMAWQLVTSQGLDIVFDEFDVRSQGWVFQHVVRPLRHGYKPIAYILTSTPHGEYGIGYQGVVADIRQGDNGELKSISLADPERFVYQVVHRKPDQPRLVPHIETHDRDWIGGVVVLDNAVIRNIVIQNIPDVVIEEVEQEAVDDGTAAEAGEEGGVE